MCHVEWRLSHDEMQVSRSMHKQTFTVRKQEVELTQRTKLRREIFECRVQFGARRHSGGKPGAKLLQKLTEGCLTVRLADGQEAAVERRRVPLQVAVMGEDPV